MKPTSLGFAALVGFAVANPLIPTNSDVAPVNYTAPSELVRPNEGFVPAKLLQKTCLEVCPKVFAGLHAPEQPAPLYCRLRCAVDAYRRSRQGVRAPGDSSQATDASREQDVPLELLLLKKHRLWNTTGIEPRSEDGTAPQAAGEKDDGEPDVPLELLLLKKHRFWNTTGIEPRSEDDNDGEPDIPLELLLLKEHRFWNTTGIEPRSENDTAPQAAGEKDDGKPDVPLETLLPKEHRFGRHRFWSKHTVEPRDEDDVAPRVEEPKGNNPCAWPSEWDGSSESGREMQACLKSCPIGPSFRGCFNPCVLEVMERRCGEKRAKETNPKDRKHSALTRRQWQPNLPPPPVNAFTARWWGKAPSWYRPHMHPPIGLGGAGAGWIDGPPKLLD
ncbi:hypothetical protein LX32DRAFT_653616 [Colletotrichum zoysiae]|uniref:Uncharacterized protein n=1 Tax=Colletotrichum zoysiae TaxID=1216348 RepID=A0AAD9HES1_9PEZI|nr:hypothetical protein LX32DRAFT_653616 [Colletotrichum zoysiae]